MKIHLFQIALRQRRGFDVGSGAQPIGQSFGVQFADRFLPVTRQIDQNLLKYQNYSIK